MKNIFSFSTHELLSLLTNCLASNNNSIDEASNDLGQLIYRYIPLHDVDEFTFKAFNERLINKIETKSADSNIIKLAELTLDLCQPYLKYEFSTSASDHLKTLIHSGSFIPFEQIETFQNDFYTNHSYRDQLIDFVILSYVYTKSKINIPSDNFLKIFAYNVPPDSECDLKVVKDKLSRMNPRRNNSTTQTKPPPFLLPFFEYDTKDPIFNSWYDGQIILGLINSHAKTKNPFVDIESKKHTNLQSFLKSFHNINLNAKRKLDITSLIEDKSINKTDLSNRIYTYNQFLLERIGNFNFINKVYSIQEKPPFQQMPSSLYLTLQLAHY